MAETRPDRRRTPEPGGAGPEAGDDEPRPLGAIAVTAFLAVVIVATWFGMYLLGVVRG